MGKFNGKIHAEFTPPNTWVLEKLLSFKTGELSSSDIEVLLEIGANVEQVPDHTFYLSVCVRQR